MGHPRWNERGPGLGRDREGGSKGTRCAEHDRRRAHSHCSRGPSRRSSSLRRSALVVQHHRAEPGPKGLGVVAVAKVHELVGDHVVAGARYTFIMERAAEADALDV
jgi:hypothetical protein